MPKIGFGIECPSALLHIHGDVKEVETLKIVDAKLSGCHGIGIGSTNLSMDLINVKCGCGNEVTMKGNNWLIDFEGKVTFTCTLCNKKLVIDPTLIIKSGGNVGINT